MFRRKFQARRRMTREEKAAEELEWRSIGEEIELSAEGVEGPLLGAYSGYSVEVTGHADISIPQHVHDVVPHGLTQCLQLQVAS